VLRASGSYRFNDGVMHLNEKVVSGQTTIIIP
jgi:hypothetical protein